MIKITKLSKQYGERLILDSINLSFPDRGVIALVGASGSGKTTLLNAIGGIDQSYTGSIRISGTDIGSLNDDELSDYRLHNIGYVFQTLNLINLETVFTNVKLPLDSSVNAPEHIKKKRVYDVLSLVGMEKYAKKQVNTLSGGEKQRVAIAKAIINSPKVLLCDEPTGALDTNNSEQVFKLLKSLSKTALVIIATHDLEGVKKVADQIIKITDGTIESSEIRTENDLEIYTPPIIGKGTKLKKSALPLSFQIGHAIHKIGSKRFRFMITNFMISLSLTGIGTSLIISNNVSEKLNDSFQSIINGNQIVMSMKKNEVNAFDGIYSASEEQVGFLEERYQKYIDGVGATYLVNFENFFKDQNDAYLDIAPTKYFINSFSIRNVNDFVWLDDIDKTVIQPAVEDTLSDDELVLGITFVDMVNICYRLKILRNYESLANYIYHNELNLCFHVKNNDWQYEDEQMFKIKGIFEAKSSQIVHSNKLWNKVVFEDNMRFPSNDGSTVVFPWEMYKLHYFHTKEDPKIFLDMALYDDFSYDYVFERTNSTFHPLLCQNDGLCLEKRVLIYYVDKHTIKPSVVKRTLGLVNELKDYYFVSDFGYASYASNFLSGFAKNMFVSIYKEKIDAAIDADTMKGKEELEISLPKGVISGNYMNSLSNGLKFSSHYKDFLYGRAPQGNDEIAISLGLARELDNGYNVLDSDLIIASECSESLGLEGEEKEYRTTTVKIVGIINEEKPYLYHDRNWTISFFRDKIGMSSFYLTPKSVVFELDDGVDSEKLISKLNKMFKDYVFTNPISELSDSINTTLSYAQTLLMFFSVIAAIISVLLLITVLILNILENKQEVKLLSYTGIRKKDINSSFVTEGMVHVFIAFLFSLFEMILIDYAISYVLSDLMGTNINYSLNAKPILIVFLGALVTSFLVSEIIVNILSSKKKPILATQKSN